jgi:hypothetical protein
MKNILIITGLYNRSGKNYSLQQQYALDFAIYIFFCGALP